MPPAPVCGFLLSAAENGRKIEAAAVALPGRLISWSDRLP